MPPNPPAQITVAYSRHFDGLIAIAHGEKWPWAHTALEQTGFTKRDDGSFHTPGDSVPAAMAKLLPIARRHRATVQVSGRPYLGDIADQIAARLPGRWTAQVEIYSNPLWQEDLLPYLWDRGDLARAVKDRRVPYAAKLDSDTGIELLLTEHSPDPEHGYLLGAFASYEEFEDSYDPHAPASITLPAGPGPAAQVISDTFLPAYHRALHERRTGAVLAALDAIRAEYDTLQAMRDSGRFSDGVPLRSPTALTEATKVFVERIWLEFLPVLTHAPGVLANCTTALTHHPADAGVVHRLGDALASCTPAMQEWQHRLRELWFRPPISLEPPEQLRTRLGRQVLPSLGVWLAEADAFARIAHAARPGVAPSPGVVAPAPAVRPALPPPSPSPHR
ncbi:hypothetical protein [Streptomyces sp. GQFP]|uniref:hypothetical protein n=1 Tax=Streptomyces sp. GQFP TaxID=2907545 RepID=UPI001F3502B5|nr:hypothetical protein [Streptomyces sp. GQFP]UIX34386.1 hypothetical protein LUX31_32715 [Streptomyces sp. GQFP]